MIRIAVLHMVFVFTLLQGCATAPGGGNEYKPNVDGKVPGVLVLHTQGGLTRHEEKFANFLSNNGYYAITVDYRKYGGSVYSIPAAYDYLASQPNVDANNMGIVGFSLGAYTAFDISDRFTKDKNGGRRIKAVVSWFIGPTTALDHWIGKNPEHPATLFVHGDSDVWISERQISVYCGYLENNEIPCKKVIYEGVGHAFDRQNTPKCWDCEGYVGWAYSDGKKQTILFLDEMLKGG